MTEKDRKKQKQKPPKVHRDDDAYGAKKLQKEFKRKKQSLREQDDLDNWSDYIK